MKRQLLLAILGLTFVVLAGAVYAVRARQGGLRLLPLPVMHADLPRAPVGTRVRVQVVNTTRTRGLARRATRVLRDQGFDVVEMTSAGPPRDSTLVLDRSGHPAWATSVAQLLGPASRAESRPDSSRYLDITVLLGAAWRAPAEPFDP